jgi:RNA polymerase sigma factor (sigma-70 family)
MATGDLGGVVRRLRRTALLNGGAGLTDGELLECYLARRDEAAFEALLLRHGPMVLAVCRRVLGNEADAHDAFQATFLVFLRKAASIARRQTLANWLYGVARKTALKAGALNRLRRAKERQAVRAPWAAPPDDSGQEPLTLLDEAISRLPDRYRGPVVLCALEGKPLKEAARQLGCPPGTVASRLARARVLLARRLKREGLPLAAGALTTALARGAAPAGVPTALVVSTVKAATEVAAGNAAAAGGISAAAAALTEGVLKAMRTTKLKVATAVLLAAAVLGTGGLLAYRGLGAPRQEVQAAKEQKAKSDREALQGTWVIKSGEKRGEKLSPEGLKAWEEMVFDGDTVTRDGPERREGKYTLDPGKKPREIDLFTEANALKGIYELKGTTLRLALRFGAERPTAFDSEEGLLLVFEKKK